MVRWRITFFRQLCLVLVAICSVADAFFTNTSSFFGIPGGENTLWDELYLKCGNLALFGCVQGRLMNYINQTLDSDLRITDGIYFTKSSHQQVNHVLDTDLIFAPFNSSSSDGKRNQRAVDVLTIIKDNETSNSTEMYDEAEAEGDEEIFDSFIKTVEKIEGDLEETPSRHGKSMNPFTEYKPNNRTEQEDQTANDNNSVAKSLNKVTDLLYDKTTNYLCNHDLRLDLPRFMFGGSRMVISPRGFDSDGGILLKLNFNPIETSRSGFGKYFHKMFKKKLLTSFLALLLIIKLIKIKLMYVLPVIIGVNAAKKILLKTLLFLFPPLVHLFKLCTFYHAHASKLHFHHHKIKHHHHHIKVPVPVPVPVPSLQPHSPHDGYIGHEDFDAASTGILDDHGHGHLHSQPHSHSHSHSPYEPIPGYAPPDYYTRNDMTNQHGDELDSWGLKDFYASTESPGVLSAQAQAYSPYAEQNYKALHAAALNKPYAAAQKKNKGSSSTWKTKTGSHGVKNTVDPFYSPILQKIDSIFSGLGFNEEGCRKRLICSMYKDPLRFSPHSNLLSTELSRDPAELERPSQSNLAAVRFYKYVEAARDGQSQKDCLSFYPECAVKTE